MGKMRRDNVEFFEFQLTCRRELSRAWASFHQHNEVELMLVAGGTLALRHRGELWRFEAGKLLVFWSAVPHQIIASDPPARLEWATAPLGLFLQWRLPEAFARDILAGRLLAFDAVADLDNPAFARWERDLSGEGTTLAEVVKLELEARFRRLALEGRPTEPARRPPEDMGRIERANRFVAANYERDIKLKDIAAAAGVHPNYLIRLYRRRCGMGPAEFVAALRVAKAQRLLATGKLKIGALAFASGFGSVHAFYQAFRKATGLTPSAYRGRHAPG